MARQRFAMKENIFVWGEIDNMRALSNRQTSGTGHFLSKTSDRIYINVLRAVTGQSHHDGDICRMTFSGQRERSIEIDHNMRSLGEFPAADQSIDKAFTCVHWPHGMGAGGSNANLENIECANHIHTLGLPFSEDQVSHSLRIGAILRSPRMGLQRIATYGDGFNLQLHILW